MSGYNDGLVACLDTEILIWHYSVLRRPKRISYSSIREVNVTQGHESGLR